MFLLIPLLIIAYFSFIIFNVFGSEINRFWNQKRFDSMEWKSWSDETPSESNLFSTQLYMVDDLIDSHLLIGKTKAQVFDLLGKNDSTIDTMYYSMGFSGHGIDVATLVVKFDDSGKVSKVSWHQG